MTLKIGEKIKQLRKAQDITQEKLADYLNISYQAVSKWENGLALPDITLLPKLANFFGVSTDWLLDAELVKTDIAIENIIIQAINYKKTGKVNDAIALIEKILSQYPNNYLLLAELIELKVQAFSPKCDQDRWLDDISRKANIILNNCTDDAIRYKAKTNLAFAYSFCGKRKETELLCDTFPERAYSKVEMYSMTAPPKERADYKRKCIGVHLGKLFVDILSIAKQYYCYEEPKDALPICQLVIDIIDTIGDEGYLMAYKAEAFSDMANAHARLQDKSNTLKYIKNTFDEYLKIDRVAETEYVYKTPIFKGEKFNREKITYWNEKTMTKNYLDLIAQPRSYSFLKNDLDFIELYEEMKSEVMEYNSNIKE